MSSEGDRLERIEEVSTSNETEAGGGEALMTQTAADQFEQEMLDFSAEMERELRERDLPAEGGEGTSPNAAPLATDGAQAAKQEEIEEQRMEGQTLLRKLCDAAPSDEDIRGSEFELAVYTALEKQGQGTLIGLGLVGVHVAHELRQVEGQLQAEIARGKQLEDQRKAAEDHVEKLRKERADNNKAHAKERERYVSRVASLEAEKIDTFQRVQELESANEKLEQKVRMGRRGTVFEQAAGAIPHESREVQETGPIFGGRAAGSGDDILRRRRTTLLENDDGSLRPMSNLDLTKTFLTDAAKSLPGNKAVDTARLEQRGDLVAAGQRLFEELALEGGVQLGTRATLDTVLSVPEMSKLVTKVLAVVKAEKYRDRSAWGDMRDVNRKLSRIFGLPEIHRGVLSEALRVEEVESVIQKWDARYTEELRILPNDNKRVERIRALAQVRAQDQELLSVALEALLAEHSAPLKEQISAKNASAVTVSDLASKGFAIMILAETCLDVDHVEKHVQSLFTIIEFPSSFMGRFHGNLWTFEEELRDSLDRFEEVTGVINKHLLRKLLVMHVMLTSTALPVKKWREHLQKAEKYQDEMRSLPLMSAHLEDIFMHACTYQKRNFTESYHKAPLPLLEYEQTKERTNFVRGDSQEPCTVCGNRHGGKVCLEEVNFKKVADECAVVLKGAAEILAQGKKLEAELSRCKDSAGVSAGVSTFIKNGEALMTRFNDAMRFKRARFNKQKKAYVAQGDPGADPVEQTVADHVGKHLESVQKATDKMQQAAQQIALSFEKEKVPFNTCWRWHRHGKCDRPDGTCKFDHLESTKGKGGGTARAVKSVPGGASTPVANVVRAALVDTAAGVADGPVSGTKCVQCKQAPKFCENGKVHNYCGKKCAIAAGVFVGKQSTNLGLGSGVDADEDPEDPSTRLMMAAGAVPLTMSHGDVCFMLMPVSSMEVQELECMVSGLGGMTSERFEAQLAAAAQEIVRARPGFSVDQAADVELVSVEFDAHADLMRRLAEHHDLVFLGSGDSGLDLGGDFRQHNMPGKHAMSGHQVQVIEEVEEDAYDIVVGHVLEKEPVGFEGVSQKGGISILQAMCRRHCVRVWKLGEELWEIPEPEEPWQPAKNGFRGLRLDTAPQQQELVGMPGMLEKTTNPFACLEVQESASVIVETIFDQMLYRRWAMMHLWAQQRLKKIVGVWRKEARTSRALVQANHKKLRMLKWRARKRRKPGTTDQDTVNLEQTQESLQNDFCRPPRSEPRIWNDDEDDEDECPERLELLASLRSRLRILQARRVHAKGREEIRLRRLAWTRKVIREYERMKLTREKSLPEEEFACDAWHRMDGAGLGFHWFGSDEEWANQYWEFSAFESKRLAQEEHVRRLKHLLDQVEQGPEVHEVDDEVWQQLGLTNIGPSRWQEAVASIDLQKSYTDIQKLGGVACQDDEDCARTLADLEQLRQWWPLSTASRLVGMTLCAQLEASRRQVCHGQMQKGLQACEELQKILQCFKITNPAGKALMLADSGSTCFLSPMQEHILVRFKCVTDITGVGQSTAKHYSPCVLGGVDMEGQYHVINYPRIYEMGSLDFPIMSTPALERHGYEFQLSSSFSRMMTPEGKIVPFVRDPGTGFHFMVDHMYGEPVLTRKRTIVQAALQSPQTGHFEPVDAVDRFSASKSERQPTGPDTADGLTELLSVNFGTEYAWPSQKQVGKVRKVTWGMNGEIARDDQDTSAGKSGGGDAGRALNRHGRVVWAKLGKHWWPARVTSMSDVPEKVRDGIKDGKVLVHFFDNWSEAAADPAKRMYQWTPESSVKDFVDAFDVMSGSKVSVVFKQQVKLALGLLPDFKPAGWEAEAASVPEPRAAVEIEIPEEDKRYANDASELEIPTPAAEQPLGEVLTDDQYFQDRDLKREKRAGKPIRMKLPAVKLVDTGVPEELAALQKYLHELLGHFGWAKIKKALPHLTEEGLVRYLRQVIDLPARFCVGCIEGKSQSQPVPQGKTDRPAAVQRDRKIYVDLSGRIEEASAEHNFHYYLAAIANGGFIVLTGLTFRSQALLGVAKLMSKLGGAPRAIQIDGEGNLNTPIAKNYLEGARQCEVITTAAGAHFRNGRIERAHQTLKGCVRAMLLHSGLSIKYWYHALQHAVLICNLLSIARDDDDEELDCTVWEHRYGKKPVLNDLLLGPFGCLAYLVLSQEQRQARNLSGHFGVRALAGVYLGCVFNAGTGVYEHVITDGRSFFSSPNHVKVIADVYPMKFSPSRELPLIPSHDEDLLLSQEGEEVSHARIYESCWAAARKAKVVQTQEENKQKPKGMKTKLQGDDRVRGKNKKRPLKIVSEVEGGEATQDLFDTAREVDAEINLEDPRDYMVEPLREEYSFEKPYEGAKYTLLVPIDFSDGRLVPTETVHPHMRYVGRKIRKAFEVDDATKKRVSRSFAGVILSYSPQRQLFKVVYTDDGAKEDLDFYEMTQVLIMGKKWGDPAAWEGKTRAEQTLALKQDALMREVREQVNSALERKIDGAYEAWFTREKERMFRAVDEVVGQGELEVPVPDISQETLYDDEPKTEKEVAAHKEADKIREAAWKEIQQLIAMSVGVLLDDQQVRELERDKNVQILRSKMVYKRKYQISPTDGKEHFLKWKARLAAVGCAQEPGVDTVWNTFSPTIGFTAIRTLLAAMCNPKWHVDSYDLSGAYLGTHLEDQAVYMKLPASAGEYSNKILRLTKSIYGLRGASKAFMKQLGEEVEKFSEKVEYTDSRGEKKTEYARFEKLITDQCMYRYRDAQGREMIFASYVDDIICCTTDLELRDRFFDHLRKTWGITHEGTLDRFLGIHFERSQDKWSWTASMGAYIDKIVKRFGLEDSRKVTTPMEPGFVLTAEDFIEEPTEAMITEMRSLIGSIGYCATAVRFDISHAVSVLSRHLARPCHKALDAAKRIIKYLAWTRDFAIQWTSSEEEERQGSANTVIGAVDASFAMDTMTRKSHGGFINFVNNGAVSWKSGLQSIVTLSSCEAEYVALCSEVCEVKYLRALMRELGHKQPESTLIWEDNKAAILIAENECSSAGRSKHIDVRFKFVAQAVAEGAVRVRYTPTDLNLADILTKALPAVTFERLRRLCVENKRGDYFVKEGDERVQYVQDERSWMVTSLW